MARGINAVDLTGFDFGLTPGARTVRCMCCGWGASVRRGNALAAAAKLKGFASHHSWGCWKLASRLEFSRAAHTGGIGE